MTYYEIRTTQLEEFINCKYLYRFRPKWTQNQAAMDLGTRMHKSVGSYLHSGRNYKAQEILKQEFDTETIRFTDACIDLVNKHDLPNLLAVELPYVAEFKVGEDTLAVKWTVDWIVDQDYMIDIKSSANLRKEEVLQYKYQWRIYPVLYSLARGKTDGIVKFDYWIFTKQKTPQFQQFKMDVNISEHLEQLKRHAEAYVLAEKTGRFEPNIHSSSCFFCPFAKSGSCPGKSKAFEFF